MQRRFFNILKLLFVVAVLCLSLFACGATESEGDSQNPQGYVLPTKHSLSLELKSEENLLFSRYDMEIYFDGEEIGTVANGKTFKTLLDVVEGDHVLAIYKVGDHNIKTTKAIKVVKDMTFKCSLKHNRNGIELRDIQTGD